MYGIAPYRSQVSRNNNSRMMRTSNNYTPQTQMQQNSNTWDDMESQPLGDSMLATRNPMQGTIPMQADSMQNNNMNQMYRNDNFSNPGNYGISNNAMQYADDFTDAQYMHNRHHHHHDHDDHHSHHHHHNHHAGNAHMMSGNNMNMMMPMNNNRMNTMNNRNMNSMNTMQWNYDNPTEIAVDRYSMEHLNGYMRSRVGDHIEAEFMIGLNTFIRRGTLSAVGSNYLLLTEDDTMDTIACDFNELRFVRFTS